MYGSMEETGLDDVALPGSEGDSAAMGLQCDQCSGQILPSAMPGCELHLRGEQDDIASEQPSDVSAGTPQSSPDHAQLSEGIFDDAQLAPCPLHQTPDAAPTLQSIQAGTDAPHTATAAAAPSAAVRQTGHADVRLQSHLYGPRHPGPACPSLPSASRANQQAAAAGHDCTSASIPPDASAVSQDTVHEAAPALLPSVPEGNSATATDNAANTMTSAKDALTADAAQMTAQQHEADHNMAVELQRSPTRTRFLGVRSMSCSIDSMRPGTIAATAQAPDVRASADGGVRRSGFQSAARATMALSSTRRIGSFQR